jgi:hypothetical protein
MFTAASYVGQTFYKTTAAERIYKRIKLFDPTIPIERKGMSTHIGGTRLGMPPFTAEMHVSINGKVNQKSNGIGAYLGTLHTLTTDKTNLNNTLAAMRQGMSVRDKILINTQTHNVYRAGSTVKSGDILCGQLEEL